MKKIKTKFVHNFIIKKANGLLETINSKEKKIIKLSQGVMSPIDLKTQKRLCDTTLYTIFTEDEGNKKNIHNYNKKILEKYCKQQTDSLSPELKEFKYLFSLTYAQAYALYKKSPQYDRDLEEVKMKDGEDYHFSYKNYADDFIFYFIQHTPNERKKAENKRKEKKNKKPI